MKASQLDVSKAEGDTSSSDEKIAEDLISHQRHQEWASKRVITYEESPLAKTRNSIAEERPVSPMEAVEESGGKGEEQKDDQEQEQVEPKETPVAPSAK